MMNGATNVIRQYLTDVERFGTKYLAQRLFKDLGLVQIDVRCFDKGWIPARLVGEATEMLKTYPAIVIRTSKLDLLNMPWQFVTEIDEAARFIKHLDSGYELILQEYDHLAFSCELLLDGHQAILQVMPGIWEVDSRETPDTVIFTLEREVRRDRFLVARKGKLLDGKGRRVDARFAPVEPATLDGLVAYCRERWEVLDLTRRSIWNPLHCYFHVDHEGRISFQNVRPSRLPIPDLFTETPTAFHAITKVEDVETWDRQSPILFDVACQRASATPIIECVKALVDAKVDRVFVKTGVLSHQAIFLRQAGIGVSNPWDSSVSGSP
jgi:hypothetical protein